MTKTHTFLGDMGVSLRVIEWLHAAGHNALKLRDEGLQRLPNRDIFRKGFVEQPQRVCSGGANGTRGIQSRSGTWLGK